MTSTATPKMLQAYDNTLLGILQHEAGLEPFLDVIFGFLSRKTDFYQIMTEPKQKYGFPVGVAEKMIEKHFRKYQDIVIEAQSKALEKQKKNETSMPKEPKAKEDSSKKEGNNDLIESDQTKTAIENAQESKKDILSSEEITSLAKNQDGSLNQSAFQDNPDSYNGAVMDKYSWSQNYDDVDVKIPVAKSVAKGKQVKIEIQRKHLKVEVKVNPTDSKMETIINNELQHEVNKEESMWSLEGGKSVVITLTKDKNIWWTKLLENDQEIDIQKICPERSMADMDEEEKAVINKLQFDEKQKRLGLPQSHELKVHEMIKKGWDAEGSPFKGQEFDPKMFNISPGSVGQ